MKAKSFQLVSLIVVLTMLMPVTASASAATPSEPPPTVTEGTFPETSTIPVWAQLPTPPPSGPDDPLTKVEPLVMDELSAANQTDFFIWMTEKADLSLAYELKTKEEKGRFVYEALTETAERTQKELRAYLDQQGVTYRPFYITNKILVRGGYQTLLLNVASRSDVARVTANHHFQLEEPFVNPNPPAHILAVETNISFINADDVWTMGYTGQGTVMAGNDTGLDWDHPALIDQYRGWDGATADHNYNWWDATGAYPTTPGDGHGHGTHTSGTMVGDDGGANQIGVAPGAQTVHCKNMTDGGGGSDATFTECFEWDLAPWDLTYTGPGTGNPRPDLAPDAINNSWGYWGGNNPVFEDEIAVLQAAGILVEVSAGNEGPGCSTLRSPSDYRQSLTTGSVDHSGGSLPGTLTGFSSRGPSFLYPSDYIPDIMAPGENIRSSLPGGTYASWGGTSMAGPHTTALIGLMWSANPGLRGMVTETVNIILDTAIPLTGQAGSSCGGDYTDGPNNDWGYGTIDALAAVEQAMLYGGTGTLKGSVTDGAATAVSDATIRATFSPTLSWQTASDALGDYAMVVFSGTYTVDAYKYGHIPARITGVPVVSGTTTTQDIILSPAAYHVVSGVVTDSTTGDPLWATIDIAGDPVDPPTTTVQTNRNTGAYSITLAAGITYTFDVAALLHTAGSRTVGPLTGNVTENFSLAPTTTNGIIAGWVRNKYTGDPVENATVQVDGGPSAATDAEGYYQTTTMAPDFYTVTASANLFSSVIVTDVEVSQSNIGWADFDLPTPQIEVEPLALSYTLELGDQFTQTPGLVISNTGDGGLDFELWEKKGDFQIASLATGPFADDEPLVLPESQQVSTTKGLDLPPAPVGTILAAGDVIQSWASGREAAWGIAYDGENATAWVGDGWGSEDALFEYMPDGTLTGRSWSYIWSPTSGPADGAFNWNTRMVWTLDVGDDNCIHEMDPAGGYTGNTICGPWTISQRGVAYDPETDTWYVGGWNEYIVYHIDSSGTLLDSANVGLAISGLAYNPETQHLFVQVSGGANDVYVLDASAPGSYPQIGQFHIGSLATGAGLEIDCEGNLWAVDQSNEMVYQAESGESASLCAQDAVPWLAEDPISATVAPSGTQAVDIGWWANVTEVDQPGAYYADLKIKSNDPANQSLVLPVTMTVTPPPTWGRLAGVVSSTGHCDVNPYPIEGAQVYLEGSGGYTFTLETNAAGVYHRWLDAAESPYTITVSYAEHPTTTLAVSITGGVTTTENFALRWLQPCVSVAAPPGGISATLDMGLNTTLPLSISNSGAVTATFELREMDGGFSPLMLTLVTVPPSHSAVGTESAAGANAPLSHPLGGTYYDPNLLAAGLTDVLLVFADDGNGEPLYTILDSYPDIRTMGTWDARYSTPALVDLLPYDVVVTWNNYSYADYIALGDVLADYVDASGKVILTTFNWQSVGFGLGGRFMDEFYSPFLNINGGNHYSWANLGSYDAGHPIMQGVTAASDYYRDVVDLDPGAYLVASWSDGEEFIATKGSVVTINSYTGFGYVWTDDMGIIFHNAVNYLMAADVPWLSEDPITGTVPSDGGLAPVNVTLDAAYVAQPGEHYATLNVDSDDPVNNRIAIPVTMTVNVPPTWGKLAGVVESLGHCDANTATLEGAQVLIENGSPVTLTTGVSGAYSYWLDQGAYTITVSATEHQTETAVVNITAQTTSIHDVALRWLQPCVSVTAPPDGISTTLDMGISIILPISISNSGAASLDFELGEQDRGFQIASLVVISRPLAPPPDYGGLSSDQASEFSFMPTAPWQLLGTGALLIQDNAAWGYNAIETILGNNGIPYDVVNSSQIATTDFTPYKMIIIPSVQGSSYNTIFNANLTKFEDFVDAGGLVLMSFCEYSGNVPYRAIPFGGTNNYGTASDNYIVEPGHPIFVGVPNPYSGNSASHSYLTNLLPDDRVLVTAGTVPGGNVVMVERDHGAGMLVAGGQTFEFGWGNGWGNGTILENMIPHYYFDWEGGGNVPWLSENPISGTVPSDGGLAPVDVTLDAAYVTQPGEYHATLNVNSDDPVNGRIGIPVTMTVNVPLTYGKLEGTVTSLGHCDTNTATLEGAEVSIEGRPVTPTTGVSGTYTVWLDQGSYTITVSYSDHVSDTATVSVSPGMTSTRDFDLRSRQPCVSAAPPSIEATVSQGASEVRTLKLTNTGAGVSSFEFHETIRPVISSDIGVVGSASNWASTLNADPELSSRYTFVDLGDNWTYATIQGYAGIVVNESDYGLTTGETDALRQYYDAGGAILMGMDDVDDEGTTEQTDVYYTFGVTNAVDGDFYVGTLNTAHPIAQGVTLANMGGDNDHFDEDSATWVVRGSDGYDYVLARDVSARTVMFGEQLSQWWSNGNQQLVRSAIEWAMQSDVPWLSEDPVAGTVDADNTFDVDITFTAFPTMTMGIYTATLVVNTDDAISDSINIPVTMTVTPAPTCGFTSSSPDDLGEMTIFANTSAGAMPITYIWDFGDGSPIVAAENPTYTYAHVGFYTVVLTATNAYGQDVCSDTVSIEGVEGGFISNSPVDLGDPTFFTNTTRSNPPIVQWFWTFGNGQNSVDENPSHIYAEPGIYTVTLFAANVPYYHGPTNVYDIYQDTVEVTGSSYGVRLAPTMASAEGVSAVPVFYTLQVDNTGANTETFDVSVNGNTWTTTVPATIGPLAAGESANLVITVTIPATALFGATNTAIIAVTSQGNPAQSAIATLDTTSNNIYGVLLAPSVVKESGQPGATVNYTLQVTNTGNTLDTLLITVSGNAWTTDAPVSVGPLASGEVADVPVTVHVPAGAAGGEVDSVTITATSQSDGTESDASALTTTAFTAVCTDVTSIDLNRVTEGAIYINTTVEFSADIALDDASKPYTYTVDYGDGTAPVTSSSSDDPLTTPLDHTFASIGTFTVEIAVWNCTMTGPVTDVHGIVISEYDIYLPLVLRNH